MDWFYSIAIIAVVAICTLLTRAFPFLVFAGRREVPQIIRYLGGVLPPAIMAILVVYCLKNVNFFSDNHGIPDLLASLLVIVLHLWKKNTLLSIGIGTICYMFLIQFVFV